MKAWTQYGLALGLSAAIGLPSRAATADAGNPYAKIVVRNAFGLKDPPKPESIVPPKDPPPKITLQGIAKVLNRKQVLFKVAMPARPPQPAAELSKILAEGEREGEIEVLEIDELAGVIKFNNHGTPETKTLKDDSAKPTPGSLAMATPTGAVPQPAVVGGGLAMPAAAPSGNTGAGVTVIGSGRATAQQAIPPRNVRTQEQYGKYGAVSGAGGQANNVAIPQTPEESVIKVEIEREINKDAISSGRYPPPPPTPITPQPTPK